MAKRLLDDWGVPPPNRSPDERRAIALQKIRKEFDPGLPGLTALSGAPASPGRSAPAPVIPPRIESLQREERETGKMGRIPSTRGHYRFEESRGLSLYDDLGVSASATQDEIKQAHKALARLLHPDQILDQYTKGLAETTLKRINAAYAVLGDPRQRRIYDEEAAPGHAPLPGHPHASGQSGSCGPAPWWLAMLAPLLRRANLAWLRRNLLWIGATLAGLAVIYWTLGPVRPPAAKLTQRKPAPAPTVAAAAAIRAAERGVKPARAEPARRTAAPSPRTASAAPRVAAAFPVPVIMPPRPAAPQTAITPLEITRPEAGVLPSAPGILAQTPAPPPAPERWPRDGLWFYLPTSRSTSASRGYLPEFIELTVRSANGLLKGRLNARYRVADQPISPEVQFQFEGEHQESGGSYSWSGNGGARGQVRLHSLSDDQLQLTWHTTEPGREARLVSGSATLVRRRSP
ncbi:MAG: J domain-containing protein [Bryobacterales bacterium]|nr:J domain-containing protein [Bryobacterales bacterium]